LEKKEDEIKQKINAQYNNNNINNEELPMKIKYRCEQRIKVWTKKENNTSFSHNNDRNNSKLNPCQIVYKIRRR